MLFMARNPDPIADLAARLEAAGSHHAALAALGAAVDPSAADIAAGRELEAAFDAAVRAEVRRG